MSHQDKLLRIKSQMGKTILKGIGVTSLAALIAFLGTIFVTKESFSEWKENSYFPAQRQQDLNINTIKTTLDFYKKSLTRIEQSQKEILRLQLRGRK